MEENHKKMEGLVFFNKKYPHFFLACCFLKCFKTKEQKLHPSITLKVTGMGLYQGVLVTTNVKKFFFFVEILTTMVCLE